MTRRKHPANDTHLCQPPQYDDGAEPKNLDTILALVPIAREHLGITTLATRHSDELDFYDLAVWQIKSALLAAYELGRARA